MRKCKNFAVTTGAFCTRQTPITMKVKFRRDVSEVRRHFLRNPYRQSKRANLFIHTGEKRALTPELALGLNKRHSEGWGAGFDKPLMDALSSALFDDVEQFQKRNLKPNRQIHFLLKPVPNISTFFASVNLLHNPSNHPLPLSLKKKTKKKHVLSRHHTSPISHYKHTHNQNKSSFRAQTNVHIYIVCLHTRLTD